MSTKTTGPRRDRFKVGVKKAIVAKAKPVVRGGFTKRTKAGIVPGKLDINETAINVIELILRHPRHEQATIIPTVFAAIKESQENELAKLQQQTLYLQDSMGETAKSVEKVFYGGSTNAVSMR